MSQYRQFVDEQDRDHFIGMLPDGICGYWITYPGDRFVIGKTSYTVLPKEEIEALQFLRCLFE